MAIELEEREEFALVKLNRPEALNALSFSLLQDLDAILAQVEDSDARALLIIGAGDKAFCAGADIKELMDRSLADQKRGAELGQRIFQKLATLPIPSVAILNGFAFGGGLELSLAATFRLATPNARMGLPEIKLGLIPGYGGTQRLPRLIGQSRAMELILTGRTVKPEEAERIGLVDRLITSEVPLEEGITFAREFSGYSKLALNFAREAVVRALDQPVYEGLRVEADLSTLAYQTDDANEGMSAFVEKRKPNFKDQ